VDRLQPARESKPARRLGDAIAIPGDYQHRALTQGPRVQRHWHRSKLELLDWFMPPRAGGRALDIGCGSGVFADALERRGLEVVAIDANPAAIAYGRETFAREGLEFRHGLLDELELEPSSFDYVTCLEVLEHILPPQIEKLLGETRKLLVPGGQLLVTTPNYRGVWPLVEWGADRFAPTATMADDQHVTRLHRGLLRDLLVRADLEVVEIRTFCTFAPFAAVLGATVARLADRVERAVDLPFGSLLVACCRRHPAPG